MNVRSENHAKVSWHPAWANLLRRAVSFLAPLIVLVSAVTVLGTGTASAVDSEGYTIGVDAGTDASPSGLAVRYGTWDSGTGAFDLNQPGLLLPLREFLDLEVNVCPNLESAFTAGMQPLASRWWYCNTPRFSQRLDAKQIGVNLIEFRYIQPGYSFAFDAPDIGNPYVGVTTDLEVDFTLRFAAKVNGDSGTPVVTLDQTVVPPAVSFHNSDFTPANNADWLVHDFQKDDATLNSYVPSAADLSSMVTSLSNLTTRFDGEVRQMADTLVVDGLVPPSYTYSTHSFDLNATTQGDQMSVQYLRGNPFNTSFSVLPTQTAANGVPLYPAVGGSRPLRILTSHGAPHGTIWYGVTDTQDPSHTWYGGWTTSDKLGQSSPEVSLPSSSCGHLLRVDASDWGAPGAPSAPRFCTRTIAGRPSALLAIDR